MKCMCPGLISDWALKDPTIIIIINIINVNLWIT